MQKLHYEYKKEFNSVLIRGEDITICPEITREQILKYSNAENDLLDIGCGSAQKTRQYVNHYKNVVGLEPSHDMLTAAKNGVSASPVTNFSLIDGVAEQLPFKNNSFAVISSILSWWNLAEVSRVLQTNGVFIIERLGPDDKQTFTQFFETEESGARGNCSNLTLHEIQYNTIAKLAPYFEDIEFFDHRWETAYTPEALWMLLNNTLTTVRNFNPVNDKASFERAIQQLEKNGRIVLTQNRITIVAHRTTVSCFFSGRT